MLLGVCTEPSPAVAQQLCRTSAPILCCVIAPRVHSWPCSAVLSCPRLALGALDLPRAVPSARGWAVWCCSLVCPQQKGRGWGAGGRALCHGRAPLTPQEPHSSGIPAEVPGGGEAVPCPGSSHPTVLGTPVPPRRGVLAAGVPCLAVGSACCSVPGLSCQPALSSRDPAPSGACPVPAAPLLALGLWLAARGVVRTGHRHCRLSRVRGQSCPSCSQSE